MLHPHVTVVSFPCTCIPFSVFSQSSVILQDLIQFPDRVNWYKAKFVSDDAPDWNAGRFLASRDAAPNLREVTFEVEISREKVPLRNGYRHIGQKARVRINGGSELDLAGGHLHVWCDEGPVHCL